MVGEVGQFRGGVGRQGKGGGAPKGEGLLLYGFFGDLVTLHLNNPSLVA